MTKNYRKLKLSKEQIKNFFDLKAIDSATDKERSKFKYFNITSIFKFKFIKNDTDENLCIYCGRELKDLNNSICQCPRCRKNILDKEDSIFDKEFIFLSKAEDFLKEKKIKYNIKIISELVLIMN